MSRKNRILSTALTLDTFTVGELAAYSGAKPNTVRAELRRSRDVIDRVELDAPTGPRAAGRPPLRYLVTDRETLRRRLRAPRQIS